MESSLRDEELFVSTQAQEGEDESDNVYLELAKAITERKCRIDQKKEKLKLMINDALKLKEKLKSVESEEKSLKKECEEVSFQKALRVKNIQNAQKSCSTLETNLCDLINKVCEEKAETRRKKDMYDAAIQDSYKTWESYKEKYESFPMSKKLKEVAIEVKNVEIQLKQVHVDIAGLKKKKKLMHDIAERKFHLSVVQLAEKYMLYQEKVREQKDLQDKLMKMKKLKADVKSGTATSLRQHLGQQHQLESTQQSTTEWGKEQNVVRSQPEVLNFSISEIQVTSPPPSTSESEMTYGGKPFDWANLLNSSALSGFQKKSAEKNVNSTSNSSHNNPTQAGIASNSVCEPQKKKTPFNIKNVGSSLKLTNLLRTKLVVQSKPEITIGKKRGDTEALREANKQEMPPCKKMHLVSESTTGAKEIPHTSHNVMLKENHPREMIGKDLTRDNSFDGEKKGNSNLRLSNSSSQKTFNMSSIGGNSSYVQNMAPLSKDTSQNLKNILSLKSTGIESKASELLANDDKKSTKPTQTASENGKKVSQQVQNKNYNQEDIFYNANTYQDNQQFEGPPIMFEPGSPAPDLIPVENNSQPLSQGNVLQSCSPIDFNLSGGSDLISPDVEVVNKEMMKVMSQHPYPAMECSGQSAIDTQKPPNSEEHLVRSKYFSDPSTQKAPLENPAGDYQYSMEQVFSPPMMGGGYDDSDVMTTTIPSPPPANTVPGVFGGSGSAGNTAGFSFSLGSSKKNTSNSSFFDLF